jgi:hypothetical protein
VQDQGAGLELEKQILCSAFGMQDALTGDLRRYIGVYSPT